MFREGVPVLDGFNFNLGEFFFSVEWYPTSLSHVRYGVLALIAGTPQRDRAGDGHRGAVRARGGHLHLRVLRAGVRETLKIIIELLAAIPSVVWGFIGLTVMNPLIIAVFDAPVGLNVLNGGAASSR